MDRTNLDGVGLRDFLDRATGVWLVNLGAEGETSLHDWVRAVGTASSGSAAMAQGVGAAMAQGVGAARRIDPANAATGGRAPSQTRLEVVSNGMTRPER